MSQKRLFMRWWYKLKTVCQETAILFYLLVLCIFALLRHTDFIETSLAAFLEKCLLVAVGVAILSEVIVMVSGIIEGIVTACKEIKKKKEEKKNKKDKKDEPSIDQEVRKLKT